MHILTHHLPIQAQVHGQEHQWQINGFKNVLVLIEIKSFTCLV